MPMSPAVRKLVLTAHVLSSVGWLGALAVFLAHSIVSVVSRDVQFVRMACLAMGLTAWFVVLPFSLASLVTGIVQALGTAWGLLRHYWVVVKLVLTAVATSVLLLKLAPISSLATAGQELSFSAAELPALKASLLAHAVGGLLVLLATTALAIYKPAGVTARGTAFLSTGRGIVSARPPRWLKSFAGVVLLLALLAIVAAHTLHA